MRPILIVASTLLAGSWALAPSPLAQASLQVTSPACHEHKDVVKMLDQQYSEAPEALGLQSNGHLVQVFVSKDGASWTIVTTRPDGLTCIVAAGEHWESISVDRGPMA